jgi:uncharacterized protein
MRIADALRIAVVGAAALVAAPVLAFDGTKSSNEPCVPLEAFRYGAQALKVGETAKAVTSLECAAERGHPLAQWKLGRMYAEGDGVPRDDLRAFEYFRSIADNHADDSPGAPQSRFVANAFVVLGHYYLDGIPKTAVKADPSRAREMFYYAATYFGDAEAQYNLGRLYIDGNGAQRDPKQALRWLGLSAQKGQFQAQATLGAMLFAGEQVPRQAARGLMWLTLAKDGAPPAQQPWVNQLYQSAMAQATDDERALGLHYLQRWMGGQRE